MVGASMVSRTAAFPVAGPVGLVSIGHEHHLGRGVRRAARRPEAARLRRDQSHAAVLQPASRHLYSEGAHTREDAMADRQDDGSSSTTDDSVCRESQHDGGRSVGRGVNAARETTAEPEEHKQRYNC